MSQDNKRDDDLENFSFTMDAINNMANNKNPDGSVDIINLEESAKVQDPRKKNLDNFSNVTTALSDALTSLTAVATSDKTKENLATAADTGRKVVGGLLGGLGNIRSKLETHFDSLLDEAQSRTEEIRSAGNFNPNIGNELDEQIKQAKDNAQQGGATAQTHDEMNEKLNKQLSDSLAYLESLRQRAKGGNAATTNPVNPTTTSTGTTAPNTTNNVQSGKNTDEKAPTVAEAKKEGEAPTEQATEIRKLGRNDIRGLDKKIKDVVYGQDEALDDVVEVLKGAVLGLSPNKNKPKGCYFFIGPSGVGKTETVVQLAKILNIPLHRFDMGEFSAENDIKKLIGAPAGYVGYEDGGQLTNAVMKDPVSIILFDEIEKAHEALNKILLGMLDNGVVTDNRGKKVEFNNVIFFATSNLGADVEYMTNLTKDEKFEYRMDVIKEKIAPEIINRYDSIIQFDSINKEVYKMISQKFLKDVISNFKESQGIELEYTDKLLDFLAKESFDPAMGGRPARRFIDKIVIKGIVDLIYDDEEGDALDGYEKLTMDVNPEGLITFMDPAAETDEKKLVATLKNTKELVARFKKSKFSKVDGEEEQSNSVEDVVAKETQSLPEVDTPVSIDSVAKSDSETVAQNNAEKETTTPTKKSTRRKMK